MLFGDYNDLKTLHGYIGTLSKSKDFIGVNLERKMLVLKWLCLFGYSNRKTILMLINCTDRGGYRFITELTKQGYIEKFENPFYNQDLFMLGKKGRGLLVENGLMSLEKKAPNKRKFSTTNRVVHENGLHQFILLLIQFLDMDITTINREVKHKSLMIDAVFDAVFPSGNESKIAIEFERTEKSRRRIEYMLVEHMKNMKNKLYNFVLIGFTDQTLHDYFIKILIDKPKLWHKDEKTKRLNKSTDYTAQYGNHNFHFFLIEDDEIAQHTNLDMIKEDKTHRLHTYLPFNQRQKVNQKEETQKKVEQERLFREQVEKELRTEIENELTKELEEDREREDMKLIERIEAETTEYILARLLEKYESKNVFKKKKFIKYLTGELELK